MNQEAFGFASLWDQSRKPDGSNVESCVLLTVRANGLMDRIHNTGTIRIGCLSSCVARALRLGPYSLAIEPTAFDALERAVVLPTRGVGTTPPGAIEALVPQIAAEAARFAG